MEQSIFDILNDTPEHQREYAEEAFVIDCLERLAEWMEQKDVNQSELADRLGISRAAVSKFLNGKNPKLRTLAAAIHVLGGRPELHVLPGTITECQTPTRINSLFVVENTNRWDRQVYGGQGPDRYQFRTPNKVALGGSR